jgi:hypothetical protein
LRSLDQPGTLRVGQLVGRYGFPLPCDFSDVGFSGVSRKAFVVGETRTRLLRLGNPGVVVPYPVEQGLREENLRAARQRGRDAL